MKVSELIAILKELPEEAMDADVVMPDGAVLLKTELDSYNGWLILVDAYRSSEECGSELEHNGDMGHFEM